MFFIFQLLSRHFTVAIILFHAAKVVYQTAKSCQYIVKKMQIDCFF